MIIIVKSHKFELTANSAKTDCPFRISGTANPF